MNNSTLGWTLSKFDAFLQPIAGMNTYRALLIKLLSTSIFGLSIYTLLLLRIDHEALRQAFSGEAITPTSSRSLLLQQEAASAPPNSLQYPTKHLQQSSFDTSHFENLAKDVLVIMRTGASTLWRRLPIHLGTLFRTVPNLVIYSDFEESIGGFQVLDACQNVSEKLKSSKDFEGYQYTREMRKKHPNRYWETASLGGDFLDAHSDSWSFDKYKFLPTIQHVHQTKPNFKWYFLIEDDTFLFWNNLLRHLTKLNHGEAHWLGHQAFRFGTTFAHGGSGMVLSQEAMKLIFDDEQNLAQRYEEFTALHQIGDWVLGHALAEKNLFLNGDGNFTYQFSANAPHMLRFEWHALDQPIFSLHHMHQRDISQMWELERSHETTTGVRIPQKGF